MMTASSYASGDRGGSYGIHDVQGVSAGGGPAGYDLTYGAETVSTPPATRGRLVRPTDMGYTHDSALARLAVDRWAEVTGVGYRARHDGV